MWQLVSVAIDLVNSNPEHLCFRFIYNLAMWALSMVRQPWYFQNFWTNSSGFIPAMKILIVLKLSIKVIHSFNKLFSFKWDMYGNFYLLKKHQSHAMLAFCRCGNEISFESNICVLFSNPIYHYRFLEIVYISSSLLETGSSS